MTDSVERLKPLVAWTLMEKLVVVLVCRGYSYKQIGARVDTKRATIKMHAENAAGKLPGNDPPRQKLIFWSRGATAEQLGDRSER